MRGMEVNKEIVSHRLFIGGLFDDIAAKDIRYGNKMNASKLYSEAPCHTSIILGTKLLLFKTVLSLMDRKFAFG